MIPENNSESGYTFGREMNGRIFYKDASEFGYNGKQNIKEWRARLGSPQNYGARIYDPNCGCFKSIDPLQKEFPFYTPYQFAGNMPISATDLDGLEPESMISKNGKLTEPVISLLNAAFNYDEEYLRKTTWKGVDKVNYKESYAQTVGNEVLYKNHLNKDDDYNFWLGLITHEQKHRDEIGDMNTNPNRAAAWLGGYILGWAKAGFDYRGNEYEKRAYSGGKMSGQMEDLFAEKGVKITSILDNKDFSPIQKSVKLKIVGLEYKYEKLQDATEKLANALEKAHISTNQPLIKNLKSQLGNLKKEIEKAKKEETDLDAKSKK